MRSNTFLNYSDDPVGRLATINLNNIASNGVLDPSWKVCDGTFIPSASYPSYHEFVGDNTIDNAVPWKQQYYSNTLQNADITGWTSGTNLPVTLSYTQAIVTNSRVYLIGGLSGSTYTSNVYTAPINSDGTLGTWTTGTSLPSTHYGCNTLVTKNRVYLLGGYDGSNYSSIVHTAPINADGTLGTWTTGTSLPGALGLSGVVVTNDRVYLLGGYNNSAYVSTVYTAPINTDGTLGTWTIGTNIPLAMTSRVITTKNRVYLLGGYSINLTYYANVYTAPINADGTLGTWTASNSLPGPLAYGQPITTNSRVYLLGGSDSGGGPAVSIVYTAPINTDGTLGTWTTGTSLPGALGSSQAIVTNSRVYLLGGSNNGSVSTVYTAPFLGGSNNYTNIASNYVKLPNIPNKIIKVKNNEYHINTPT